jgi:hypothetical protein
MLFTRIVIPAGYELYGERTAGSGAERKALA